MCFSLRIFPRFSDEGNFPYEKLIRESGPSSSISPPPRGVQPRQHKRVLPAGKRPVGCPPPTPPRPLAHRVATRKGWVLTGVQLPPPPRGPEDRNPIKGILRRFLAPPPPPPKANCYEKVEIPGVSETKEILYTHVTLDPYPKVVKGCRGNRLGKCKGGRPISWDKMAV